jgi:cell division ATPase FtsA
MGIFFNKKDDKKLVLVFDIGSASVGGAVFEVHKSESPKIILSIREPIIFKEKISTDHFLKETIKSLEIVSSIISLSGIGKPSRIFCVLSSPWYASQTRIIKLEKNTPFLFTPKIANDLIEKEISLFQEENGVKFKDPIDKIRPIEFKNIKTLLNGYVTSEPFNKKVSRIEMNVFISMSPEHILKNIEQAIFRHFHIENINFSSFAMASFSVARDIFSNQKDFLLTDIAGELTDISIVKNEVLKNSISYPLGRNFIVRGIAENLKCTLREAESLISLYKDKHAEESVAKKIEPFINKLKKEWLQKFQESLVNLSDNISVPSTIFLTADPDLIAFFSEIILAEQFNQYTSTESKFKVIPIGTQIFHGISNFGESVERDPFLLIEAVYLNRFIC